MRFDRRKVIYTTMPERFFISPHTSPAQNVAEKLFEILKPKRDSADFENSFLIAPTKNSARKIAEAFAKICHTKEDCATAGLEFVTPNVFLGKLLPPKPTANIFESLGALKKIIENLNAEDYPSVFSKGKDYINPLSFAKTLKRLRSTLVEAAHDFNTAYAEIKKRQIADAHKWAEFARIENLYVKELARISKSDPDSLAIEAARNPSITPSTIILAGLADMPKAMLDALKILESRGSEIIVMTISTRAELFDEWGLPLPDWTELTLGVTDSQITLCADTRDQAQRIAEEVSQLNALPDLACDEGASMRMISAELASAGVKTFSPEGEKLSDSDVFAFLKMLKNHYDATDPNASFALLRCPIFTNYISKKSGMPPAEVREIIDEYKTQKLCSHLEQAGEAAHGVEGRVFLEAVSLLEEGGAKASATLEKILTRTLGIPCAVSPNFEAACEALAKGLDLLRGAENLGYHFQISQALQILIEHCDARVFATQAAADDLRIQNWLEIFWSDNPDIFIADFNEAKVPERIFGDAFMPDNLRAILGIRDNAFRHTRDATMLDTLLCGKRTVKIFVPKIDANADPLRPSRLLLQNVPDILPRVGILFAEKSPDKSAAAFEKSWNLKITPGDTPEYLSATDFKIYLECPFRFYLERILKASAFNPEKAELDAMQLGEAVHDAFFKTAKTHTLDADEISESLVEEFRKSLRKKFGKTLPPAAMLQAESFTARLRAAAFVEATHREQGWKTIALEEKFEPLNIAGFKIKSRIDRIDQHPDGALLIVDYKTADSFATRARTSPAEAAHFSPSQTEIFKRWKDLQLPLYRQAVIEKYQTQNVACAYFTLPKNTDETNLEIWNISEDVQQDAIACAEFVAEQIRNKNFEPSEKSTLVRYYPELFGWTDAESLKNFLEIQK